MRRMVGSIAPSSVIVFVWGVGSGPFGGAVWHHENGAFVDAFDTAGPLYSISGSRHVLPWVVGANGATLRLVDQPR